MPGAVLAQDTGDTTTTDPAMDPATEPTVEEPVQQTDEGVTTEEPIQQTDEGVTAEEPIQQTDEGVTTEEPVQQTDEGAIVEEPVQQEDEYVPSDDYPTEQQAGDLPSTGTTEADIEEVTEGVFESPAALTFRGGPLNFQDSTGDYDSRMAAGITLGANFTGNAPLHLGAETGFTYSHLGSPTSGFFGDSESGQIDSGANAFLVPLQLVVGANVSDNVFLGVLAGGTLLYRSIGRSIQIGREGDASTDDQTDILPSLGLNAGFDIAKNTALTLRGDYIPTADDDMVVATLGIGVGL